MNLYFHALFDMLFRRDDIEFPPRAGDTIQFMQNDFDAILSDLSWGYGTWGYGMDVIGTIRGDKKRRFLDGQRIHTSEIQEVYIITRNSIYKVEDGSWAVNWARNEEQRPGARVREHGPEFGQFDYRTARYGLFDTEEYPTTEPDHLPGNLGGQP